MNKLSVLDLNKGFGQGPLLQEVSFDAKESEVLGILGASGGGKTTLLRCLAQLESLDSGTIALGQETCQKKIKSAIGMVFQHCHLWPHLSVLNNLTLAPIQVLKSPKAEVTKEAYQLLQSFGLEHKAETSPSQLSGGEQQRIAIARALMMQPKVILFDEPTSALDPERARDLVQILQTLVQQGVIVIIASHDLPFIQKAANRVLFFEKGKIVDNALVKAQTIYPTCNRFEQFLKGGEVV